jgi:hypothetical protein
MRQVPNLCAVKASAIGVDEFSLGYTINVAKIVQHFISLSDEAHLLCQNISRVIAIVRYNVPQMCTNKKQTNVTAHIVKTQFAQENIKKHKIRQG